MTMLLSDRINYLRDEKNATMEQIADVAGVTQAAVSQWCNGKTTNIKSHVAQKLAEYYKISAKWLSSGEGLPTDNTNIEIYNYTTIPYKRITFQCGEGYEPSYEDLLDKTFIKLENKFFIDNQVSPNHCICVKVEGDSMEPLIYNGEYVVIDQNERNNIKEGKVYAFGVQGKMRIKRLYPKIDGSLVIKSENKNFEDDHVPPELMDSVVIIGRVVARIGTAPFK